MKKIITLVCLLLLAGTAAWDVSLIGSGIGGYECVDALIYQNFEGTGYDNEESWAADAYCDPDYTGIEASNILNCRWFYELVYFLFLFLAGTAWGGSLIGSGVGDECTGALICQNFEDTGYDNGESWTEVEDVDEDFTTVVIRGDQSCVLGNTSGVGAGGIISPAISSDELWGHFIWRFEGTLSGDNYFLIVKDINNVNLFQIYKSSSAIVGVRIGGTYRSFPSAYPISASTNYHIWYRFKPGDGTAECDVWVGTTTTRPETTEISRTGETADGTINHIYIISRSEENAYEIVDQILNKNSNFSSVPE